MARARIMDTKRSTIFDRRRLLKTGGAALAGATISPLLLTGRTIGQPRTVFVNTWGGSWTAAEEAAFFKPFTEATGVTPDFVQDNRSISKKNVLRGHTSAVSALAFSRDSSRLASCGADTRVLVWELGAVGGPVGAFILGLYLFVSIRLLGRH